MSTPIDLDDVLTKETETSEDIKRVDGLIKLVEKYRHRMYAQSDSNGNFLMVNRQHFAQLTVNIKDLISHLRENGFPELKEPALNQYIDGWVDFSELERLTLLSRLSTSSNTAAYLKARELLGLETVSKRTASSWVSSSGRTDSFDELLKDIGKNTEYWRERLLEIQATEKIDQYHGQLYTGKI